MMAHQFAHTHVIDFFVVSSIGWMFLFSFKLRFTITTAHAGDANRKHGARS